MTIKKATVTTANVPARKTPVKKLVAPAKPIVKSAAKSGVKAVPEQSAKKLKKEHKVKVMRDSFTMPQIEYAKIAEI